MGRPKIIDDATLLERVRELFTRHGHAVSTRELAKAVGLSQPALYRRFGSKDALYAAAMGPAQVDPGHIVGPAAKAAREPLAEHLAGLLARLRASLSAVLPGLLHAAAARHLDPAVVAHLHAQAGPERVERAIRTHLARLQRQGLIRGDIDVRAVANWMLWTAHGQVIASMFGGQSAALQTGTDAAIGAALACGIAKQEGGAVVRSVSADCR